MSNNRTVNLNTNATALLQSATRVRVRLQEREIHDGILTRTLLELQIRPTDRVSAKLLPEGEQLYDLRSKKQAVRGTKRFTVPGGDFRKLECGTALRVETRKHGWLALIPGEKVVMIPGQPQPAGASVSDR